jgi:hypothetical protein
VQFCAKRLDGFVVEGKLLEPIEVEMVEANLVGNVVILWFPERL